MSGAPTQVTPTRVSSRTTTSRWRRARRSWRATTRSWESDDDSRRPMVTTSSPTALSRIADPVISTGSISAPVTRLRASSRAWAQPGATSPLVPAGVWAQSPIADTDGSSVVRRSCPTITPRSVSRPASAASAGVGDGSAGEDDQVGGDGVASVQGDTGDVAVLDVDRLDLGAADEVDAEVGRGLPHDVGHRLVEVTREQIGSGVDDRDSDAAVPQTAGGLQPERSATDDDRMMGVQAGGLHVPRVVEAAKHVRTARQAVAQPGNRDDERPRPGGEHQMVVRKARRRPCARPCGRGRSRARSGPCGRARPTVWAAAARRGRRRPASSWVSSTRLYGSYGSSPRTSISAVGSRRLSSSAKRLPTMPAPMTTTFMTHPSGSRRRTP